MAKAHAPVKGSRGVWPRKRSKRGYARVRSWKTIAEALPLGFAGYKAGMTHVTITDGRKTSTTKGMQINVPVTVIECPPIRVSAIRAYKRGNLGLSVAKEVSAKPEKDLKRKLPVAKKLKDAAGLKAEDFDEIRLLVHTQPRLTGIGKKRPEVFELGLGGSTEDQLAYAKAALGKDIHIADLFKAGETVDIHAVTKGKGFQGPMKRFGIKRTSHKSEKSIRNPGSLGGWKGQSGWMWRVAKAGQTGYHVRTEYNKWLMDINSDSKTMKIAGGFLQYGELKNPYILLKGSIAGARKRLIRFSKPMRSSKKIPTEAPAIIYVSLTSKQGK